VKILIDIGHPAHVHLFKNFAWEMQKKGHKILFTCREKEFEIELLTEYKFDYISFGRKHTTKIGKILGMLRFDLKMIKTSMHYKPDIFISHGSIYAAQVAWLLKKPHIALEDTFNFEQIRLYKPFSRAILTGSYSHPDLGRNNVKYNGYHELAYLHPNIFKPDSSILNELGIKKGETFTIVRFVSWRASHDSGHHGISVANKIKAVKEFSRYSRVLISSEGKLPGELEAFRFKLAPEKMHDAMAFASLIYGESATMVAEGAMLGVPGIYLDDTGRLYTKEQEDKYGLVFNYSESLEDQERSTRKGVELLQKDNLKKEWEMKRGKMLNDKIDVSKFLVWFVENYPESMEIMKNNPEYQLHFR
jgi:predicted glycosyltransferase